LKTGLTEKKIDKTSGIKSQPVTGKGVEKPRESKHQKVIENPERSNQQKRE
jgi:hypothetical protein